MVGFFVMRAGRVSLRAIGAVAGLVVVGLTLWGMGGGASSSHAQQTGRVPGIYDVVMRPDSASYRTFSTGDYQLIYPASRRAEAERLAQILRDRAARTRSIIGEADPDRPMPIVLNDYNDRANGFVRPFPFKQEIELPSIRRVGLTARYPSWPASVMPHELTHALHAEYQGGFGVGRIMRWFAPDAARALNLSAPRGWTEGVAVYRESQIHRGAGRLNLPAALMPYRAALGSESPWRLSHVLHPPRYTQPFDRHYLGGGQLFQYLVAHAENPDAPYAFFQRAAAWNYRFPLFGYGAAIWYGTKTPTWRLSDAFVRSEQQREAERIAALGTLTDADPVIPPRRGLNHRRPLWVHPDTLLVHRSGYRTVPGLYRVHVPSGEATRVAAYRPTSDYHMRLAPDSQAVWTSRYVPARAVPTQSVARIEVVDAHTGDATQPPRSARMLAPAPHATGAFWAAQIDGPAHRLVYRSPDAASGDIAVPLPPRTRIQELASHPASGQTVALLNRAGRHVLHTVTYVPEAQRIRIRPLFGFEDAAMYNVSWGPSGNRLVVSADPTGVPNVFVIDLQQEAVYRATNEPYGALEPAFGPAGERIAYVRHAYQRHDLVTIPADADGWMRWDGGVWNAMPSSEDAEHRAAPSEIDADIASASDTPYRAQDHLAPRMVYPAFRFDTDELENTLPGTELGLGVGLGVAGADPLQRWAYRATTYYQAGAMWGEARVQTGRGWGQPSLGIYRRPYTTQVGLLRSDTGTVTLRRAGVEERGVDLQLMQPFVLHDNVHRTLLQVRWRSEFRQTRLFADFIDTQPLRNRITLRPQVVYAHRLQQNVRDLVPRVGGVVAVSPFVDAWADGIPEGRALQASGSLYLPWLDRFNTGVRLGVHTLSQNRGAIFDLDTFVPRGYSDIALPAGTYVRADVELVQPVWYPDRGSTLLGVMANAFYLYGTGQTLRDTQAAVPALSSATVGIGARLRLGYNLPVDIRFGTSYRFRDGTWEHVFR